MTLPDLISRILIVLLIGFGVVCFTLHEVGYRLGRKILLTDNFFVRSVRQYPTWPTIIREKIRFARDYVARILVIP
jgi:hypothetical protein